MQFLAIRSDRQPTPDIWRSHVHKQNVGCAKCNRVIYQLWAPILNPDDALVREKADWLEKNLLEDCPEHPDWFHLPEPEGAPAA